MARFVINSKKLGAQSFFMPSNGGYVRLESPGKEGTLGAQICDGGKFMGNTISASPDSFEKVCKNWHRARMAKMAVEGV